MKAQIGCKNPQHPGTDRLTMVLVKDSPIEEVWACKACLDVNKVYSVQARTKTKYQQAIRKELAKQGRLAPRPETVRTQYYR